MLVNKAYKFRLYPTCEQEILINKTIGSSRYVYNYYLNERKEKYDKDKITISLGEMKKDLKNLSIENPWLKEVDSTALRTSLEDLDRGYINFFEGRGGYPKFKVKVVKENDLIITEDLQVKKMIETKDKNNKRYHLPKEISGAVFSEILRQIEYKSKWNSKKHIKVNTYFPSSKICSHCGKINKIVSDLSIRKFECVSCGSLNDRDINASINLLTEGVKLYYKRLLSN